MRLTRNDKSANRCENWSEITKERVSKSGQGTGSLTLVCMTIITSGPSISYRRHLAYIPATKTYISWGFMSKPVVNGEQCGPAKGARGLRSCINSKC